MNILKTTNKINFDKPIKDFSKEELNFLLYSPHIKLENSKQGFIQSYSWEGIINRIISRAGDLRGISRTKSKTDKPYWITKQCSSCNGGRLNQQALSTKINGKNIGEYSNLPITTLIKEIEKIDKPLVKSIVSRVTELLQSLIDVGIGYVSLNRSVDTLSGGETQRIKLARELGSDLIETIYILDEPTAGLHPKDVSNLINILKKIRDSQNTVIVVEHDKSVIKQADHLIEIGPGAGQQGGEVVATGTPQDLSNNDKSLTGKYLSNQKKIHIKSKLRKPTGFLEIKNASLHNLKNVSVKIPTGIFTTITGVSGSGKSTLINETFVKQYQDKIIFVDQSQIGASPRGNTATYTKTLDFIREIFAKENRVNKSLFSSNSMGGCPDCKGLGHNIVDMHFMASVQTTCETCQGQKYTSEVLGYKYKNKNIYEVLEMTVDETTLFFENQEIIKRLQLLTDVGLGYLSLGQTLNTLSGGESQRLKLASQLHKKGEFYVLDEPTSGLHFADIERLLRLLHGLVDNGNSVLVIEHNLDVIRSADWIIDLGPEGGDMGGEIVAEGEPDVIAKNSKSYTGRYLLKDLSD